MNDICEEGSYRDAFEILMRAIYKNDIKFFGSEPFFAVNAVNMVRQACTNADIGNDLSFGQWISVNDRLPKNDDWVLVYGDGKICMAFVDQDDQWCADADGYDGHIENVDWVTHWMPLPKAPKE